MKLSEHLCKLPLILSLSLVMGSSVPAWGYSSATENLLSVNRITSTPLSDRSDNLLAYFWRRRSYRAPGRRRPGARRSAGGVCLAKGAKTTPLLPPNGSKDEDNNFKYDEEAFSTAATAPAIFFHLPETKTDDGTPATMVEFSLQKLEGVDENGVREFAEIYYGDFELPGQAGIVGIDLAELAGDEVALEPGELYRWEVAVLCRPADMQSNPRISGLIQLDDNPQAAAVKNKSLEQRPASYADQGVWYSMVASFVELMVKNPGGSASQELQSLLKEVGQEDIADEPFVGFVR